MQRAYAVSRLRSARRDPSRVRLEGVHALKHAVRFGAEIEVVATPDRDELERLLTTLAPDVTLPVAPVDVDAATWATLVGRELPSPVLAVAVRPPVAALPDLDRRGRLVVLEQPRHLGNLGAVVRVAAAADAAGVCVIGDADPWHPTAVRAAAGLQFALPACGRLDTLPELGRPLVALDPDGAALGPRTLPADAAVVLGTERGGLSAGLRRRADTTVRIPMRAGVSSLNLATAAAVVLYA
ncbi:TrmH family RNA methyltransferase [Egicoccus halophilus]|uniref:rRNA methyltransferase n=1 Tax=Egicoccus halophilus TaxID=1670830 RepID=A0A8J3ET49_9ACTN|nr:TrmH family RNA methyltransferase [Egicoccus halophilus]GGI08803.1 rRNA methyltransferase [Egicoccus halophilus]